MCQIESEILANGLTKILRVINNFKQNTENDDAPNKNPFSFQAIFPGIKRFMQPVF